MPLAFFEMSCASLCPGLPFEASAVSAPPLPLSRLGQADLRGYTSVDNAIMLIKSLGPGAYLSKAGITDAWKIVPIHLSIICLVLSGILGFALRFDER